MELCLRIENTLKVSRKWFTRDKSKSVTCSSEVVKRSPMSTGVGSALDEVKERMVHSVEPPTARVEERRIQLCEGWRRRLMNAELSELRQEAL